MLLYVHSKLLFSIPFHTSTVTAFKLFYSPPTRTCLAHNLPVSSPSFATAQNKCDRKCSVMITRFTVGTATEKKNNFLPMCDHITFRAIFVLRASNKEKEWNWKSDGFSVRAPFHWIFHPFITHLSFFHQSTRYSLLVPRLFVPAPLSRSTSSIRFGCNIVTKLI